MSSPKRILSPEFFDKDNLKIVKYVLEEPANVVADDIESLMSYITELLEKEDSNGDVVYSRSHNIRIQALAFASHQTTGFLSLINNASVVEDYIINGVKDSDK